EGGAISGGSPEELKALELHRWHGQVKSGFDGFDTLLAGGKYNLSDVAAAVGLGQLKRLEEFNARRRALIARYYELWRNDAPLRLPERGDEGHSWHVVTPLLPLAQLSISRAQFMQAMKAQGIGTGVHYPAIHLFSAYRALGYRDGQFPNAERIGRETVTLPLFPAMQPGDVERVVAAVNGILSGARRWTPRQIRTSRSSSRCTTRRRGCPSSSSGCTRHSMRSAARTRKCSSMMAAGTVRRPCCARSSSSAPI